VPVVGGNIVSARKRALDLARRNAVSVAVATLLTAEQVTAQQTALNGTVYRRHVLYVRSYRVLEEGDLGHQFRVRVAAVLDLKRLQSDLQRLLGLERPGGKPVVCLSSQARVAELGATLVVLRERLTAAGFPPHGGTQGAVCVATLTLGLVVEPADGVRGLSLDGARAQIVVKLDMSDGTTLFSRSEQEWGVGASPAVARLMASCGALDRAMPALVRALRQQWPHGAASQDRQVVRITGIRTTQQYRAIQVFLEKKVPGVRQVSPRRLDRGQVSFDLVGGILQQVARLLAGHEHLLPSADQTTGLQSPSFRLKLRGINGGTLWMTVIP